MIPLLKLTGWMPRRLYLPLECKRADKARSLFEEVRDFRVPLAVFWHWSDLSGNVHCKRAGCDFAPAPHPLVSGPLPVELWKGALHVTNGSGQSDEIEQVAKGLEIRLVLRDPHDTGLLITWNPNLFPNLTDRVGNPRQTRTLVLAKQIKNLEASSVADTGAEVVLQLSLLALKKSSAGASPSVADDNPVQGGLWDWLTGLIWGNWHFEPPAIRIQAERPRLSADARNMAVVCLDFGTSATAASYLEQVAGSADQPELQPVRDLRPWSLITVHPEFTQQRRLGSSEIGQTLHCYGIRSQTKADDRPPLAECVPETVRRYRYGLSESQAQRTAIPSMLYALPEEAEQVLPEPPDAIGLEVEGLLSADRIVHQVETRQFLYAPKLTVSQKSEQYATFAAIRKGRSPVELFLREYFNQLHQKLLRLEVPVLPIERICYSYPVVWVKHQRDELRRHIEEAVKNSYLCERMVPEAERKVNPYHSGFSMDEASASFLGFIQYRVGGLEGDDLVRAYQPFEPDPEKAKKYPKKMRVLVFDSGGGTTDVAFLEIIDQGGAAYDSVQSFVRKYFALTKAGLEVTRRVAEHLKDLIVQSYPAVRENLRTNLLEEGLEERVNSLGLRSADGKLMSEATVRRRRTIAFFDEAERLKISLCAAALSNPRPDESVSEPIQWTANAAMLEGLPGVSPDRLPQRLSLKTLQELIEQVYKPVADQIARWFEDRPERVDLLLMTGRSSELPGLRNLLEKAIPQGLRPYAFDWITRHNLFLHSPPAGVDVNETAKTLVQEGLRLLYRNRTNTVTKAVNCNPIDETRRDRAIGVMAQDLKTGRPDPAFLPSVDLLVEADGQPIDPERDLVYEETNPTSKGFFLGINFSGRNDRKESPSDPPLPFMRIRITGGEIDSYKRLRFYFRQRSATDVVLHRLELYTSDDRREPPQIIEVESKEDEPEQVARIPLEQGTSLEVRVQPYSSAEDFRLTGRIHLKKPAIDDVEA